MVCSAEVFLRGQGKDKIKVVSLFRGIIPHLAAVKFHYTSYKGEPMAGPWLSMDVAAPEAVAKYLTYLWRFNVFTGGKYIELDPIPAWTKKIGQHIPAIGQCLFGAALLIPYFCGIFYGIGNEVGINLGQKTYVHQERHLFGGHLLGVFDGYPLGLQPVAEVGQLRDHDLLAHDTFLGPQDELSLFKMITAEETLQEHADKGMMPLQFRLQIKQLLPKGPQFIDHEITDLGGASALLVLQIPNRVLQFLQRRNLFAEFDKKKSVIHVGDDHIMFDIPNQGVNELDVVDILAGNLSVMKIVSDPIRVFREEKTIGITQS